MRKTGLGLICWGIVLVALDYQYQGIYLIPDIIGYVLIVLGFRYLVRMGREHPWFVIGLYASGGSLLVAIAEQILTYLQYAQLFALSDAGFISIFVLDAVCFALMGWAVMWGLSLECQANKEPQAARQCKIYGWIFAPVALICYVLSKISGGTLFTVTYMIYILISIGLLMMVKMVQNTLEE